MLRFVRIIQYSICTVCVRCACVLWHSMEEVEGRGLVRAGSCAGWLLPTTLTSSPVSFTFDWFCLFQHSAWSALLDLTWLLSRA